MNASDSFLKTGTLPAIYARTLTGENLEALISMFNTLQKKYNETYFFFANLILGQSCRMAGTGCGQPLIFGT